MIGYACGIHTMIGYICVMHRIYLRNKNMKKFITVLWLSLVSMGVWHCNEDVLEPFFENIPDLIVSTLSVSSTSVAPSEEITLTATIRNTGSRSSTATTLRWYRSTNSTIDTNDTPVGISALSSLSAGDSITKTISTTVPNGLGIYYYGVCVDSVAGEVRTANNCSSAERVDVNPGIHLPTRDFNTLYNPENRYLYDIWSDGTTMWVADSWDDKLYAYDMASKARVPAKDFRLATGNGFPHGMWSDGTTMWVADWIDDKIYAYSMSTKARVPARDFNTLSNAGNRGPRGIWSDGTTMWGTDDDYRSDDKRYAYDLATKARVPAKDFPLATGNGHPIGIWSDGTTMWVADWIDDKIYAYDARFFINTKSFTVSTRLAEIAAAPDLIVSTLSANNTIVDPSNTITLSAIVHNTGGRSSATTTLRWYRSTNSTITTTDTLVGTNALSNLEAGMSVTISNRIMVPRTPSTYYYGACVDTVMGEFYTNDNCPTVRVLVTLTLTVNAAPRNGNLDSNGDQDNYYVQLNAGTTYTITLDGPLGEDFDLALHNPSGSQVKSSRSGSADETITYTPTRSGFYRVWIRSFSGSGSYTIGVSG